VQTALRSILFSSAGPGFLVAGVGLARSLRELGTMLDANPSANVTMLGDYNASRDGVFSHSVVSQVYTGIFDGNGCTIRNFRVFDSSNVAGGNDGLFSDVGDNTGTGTVKNLTLQGSIIQTARERTAIAGGRFLLGVQVGGLVAVNKGTIDNCTTRMSIYGSGSGGQFGGLVAKNEQWSTKTITAITQANPGKVTSTAHALSNGQVIFINGVAGMTQVNNSSFTVTVVNANEFTIGVNTTGYGAYTSGGDIFTGAGTVQNCTFDSSVVLSADCYNPYQGSGVAYNLGTVDNCTALASCVLSYPSGYSQYPVLQDQTAIFTGSISGTTLTVSSVAFGTLAVGGYIYAPDAALGEVIAADTLITADTGGGGGVGTYTINNSQTVSSRDLMTAGASGTSQTTGSWMGPIGAVGASDVGESPYALIENCTSYVAPVNSSTVQSACYTGGIVGYVGDGTVQDCVAYGTVTGSATVGGIVGNLAISSGIIQRCGARGIVIGTAGNVGGVAGQCYGSVIESWASGTVTGTTSVGGLIGLLRETGVLLDVFAHGNVTGTINVGGLVGQIIANASIENAYSLGVPVGNTRVAGTIGLRAASVTCTAVYWDIDSSGTAAGVASGATTGVSGLSDAALLGGMPVGFGAEWSRGVITPNYPIVNTAATPPNPTVTLNPPASISLVGSSTSVDSATIDMPSGIASGDYAWLVDFSQNATTSPPALVTPAGFTNVLSQTSAAVRGTRIAHAIKILDGTETTITGIGVGVRGALKVLLVFRPTEGATWTRLNARCVVNGAGTGVASQTMGAGTAPCIIVGAGYTQSGTLPTPQISTGDDDTVSATSVTTPENSVKVSYKVNNTSTAASTFNADTTAGVGAACVNVSLSA
jgi:hypothetical protein